MSYSSKGSLSTRIARLLITTESTYHHVRRAQLLAMYVSRRAHEQDFKYFHRLNGQEGLFIDVGANIGQSAISLALFNSTYRIHSFERYTQIAPSLRFAKRLSKAGSRAMVYAPESDVLSEVIDAPPATDFSAVPR
jgi:hypothetical protein